MRRDMTGLDNTRHNKTSFHPIPWVMPGMGILTGRDGTRRDRTRPDVIRRDKQAGPGYGGSIPPPAFVRDMTRRDWTRPDMTRPDMTRQAF